MASSFYVHLAKIFKNLGSKLIPKNSELSYGYLLLPFPLDGDADNQEGKNNLSENHDYEPYSQFGESHLDDFFSQASNYDDGLDIGNEAEAFEDGEFNANSRDNATTNASEDEPASPILV
jgi:hypothetical protein